MYDIGEDKTTFPAGVANVLASWTNATYGGNCTTYSNGDHNPSDSSHESKVFYGLKSDKEPNWYAGSLNRNNKEAIFYLEPGKRYLARIRAVNEAGDSEYATTEIYAGAYAEAAVGTGAAASDHVTYCKPKATSYTVAAGLSTAETAKLATAEAGSAVKFNTEIINLFRVRYELCGGSFTPDTVKKVYYFDWIDAGKPIMQPDNARKIGLADEIVNNDLVYNGTADADGKVSNAVIKLTNGTGSAEKKWTSWRQESINGTKWDSDYNQCTDATVWSEHETYYKASGSSYGVTKLSEAPADWSKYYTATLKPYTEFTNLVLYAIYTSNTFGVTIKNVADYLIENNMFITASLTGEANAAGDNPIIRTSAKSALGVEKVKVLETKLGSAYNRQQVTAEMIGAGEAPSTVYYQEANGSTTTKTWWLTKEEGDVVYIKSGSEYYATSITSTSSCK